MSVATNRFLQRLSVAQVVAIALGLLAIVGTLDLVTGFELGMLLFYLAPVALSSWYAGKASGLCFVVLCSVVWYLADSWSGHRYSYPAISIWNALIRFGFFYITMRLLLLLRESLMIQQQLAQTDSLTGLYSRRAFDQRLSYALALASRRTSTVAVAYIDLDNFKSVNDRWGHATGDVVLQTTAARLNASLREGDTAARLGGDEFALILPDVDAQSAEALVTRIHGALQDDFNASDWPVGASIGVVLLPPGTASHSVIEHADQLMYQVKRSGKGNVAVQVLTATSTASIRAAT